MKNNYLKHLKNNPILWLLEIDLWTKYKTVTDFMDYKGWDFANKKELSTWVTFLYCRVLKRWYDNK